MFNQRANKLFMEAKRIGYNFIGTEHLLIGIIKENNSFPSQSGHIKMSARKAGK